MNIVVDTNIIFSALLNSEGTIGDLILNSSEHFNFFAPSILNEELDRHHSKLLKLSGYSKKDLIFLERIIFNKIELIDLETIQQSNWVAAIDLVKNVDEFDAPFIALSMELESPLWTGDKKLRTGLKNKGFHSIFDTNEIQKLREK